MKLIFKTIMFFYGYEWIESKQYLEGSEYWKPFWYNRIFIYKIGSDPRMGFIMDLGKSYNRIDCVRQFFKLNRTTKST